MRTLVGVDRVVRGIREPPRVGERGGAFDRGAVAAVEVEPAARVEPPVGARAVEHRACLAQRADAVK